jgi:hypothetical protein
MVISSKACLASTTHHHFCRGAAVLRPLLHDQRKQLQKKNQKDFSITFFGAPFFTKKGAKTFHR